MKISWKASILQMAESDNVLKWGADDHNAGCDNFLLSYEHFYLPNLPSKMWWEKFFLLQQLECRCGPTATVRSQKVTWNEGPDQALQGKRLSSGN